MTLTLTEIAVDQLAVHPRNIRLQLGDVDELTASIAAVGLLEPVLVAPVEQPTGRNVVRLKPYMIIAGHRRLAAAHKAGLATVPAIVRADLDTEAKQVEAMLVENLHRADLSPIEEARGYEQLTVFDYDVEQIARKVGRSPSTVRTRLALVKLADREQERLHSGQLTIGQAEALLEFVDDEKAYAALADAAGSTSWQWRLVEARQWREATKAREATEAKFKADKVKIATIKQLDNRYSSGLNQLVDKTTGAKLTRAGHADCAGHRGYGDPKTGKASYLCTDPAKYGHCSAYDFSRSATVKKEETADRTQTNRILAALEAAGESRKAFITALVREKPPQDALPRILVSIFDAEDLPDLSARAAMQARGLLAADEGIKHVELLTRMFGQDARGQLNTLLAAALLEAEYRCRVSPHYRDWEQVWQDTRARAHIKWLVDHGYELSDIETEVLAATAPPAIDEATA